MLRFKISPPPLPECVDRPRLLRVARSHPIIVLAAPAGHGKTCLAAQIGSATGGPTAWFVADELDRDRAGVVAQLLGALGAAWKDLGYAVPPTVDDDAAVPLLGAALETLAGPGCLIIDDAHLLPSAVLNTVVRTAASALPPDCRLVICTRASVPETLVRAEAMGRAVSVGAHELAYDREECGRVCGSAGHGDEVYSWTGGWPLAVALATRVDAVTPAPHALRARHVVVLADLALADLAPAGRDLLVVLARLPHFPARLLSRLGDRYRTLQSFGGDHPELLRQDDRWWSPLEWVRDALRTRPADRALVGTVARALSELDEDELAAQLLLAETCYEEAVPLIERLAHDGLQRGRAAWVRALIAPVPSSARTLTLDLWAAAAAQALNIVEPGADDGAPERVLLELVDRAASEDPGALLQARCLLARHYHMAADARLFTVCEAALSDALRCDTAERPLQGRWSPEDTPAAAEMLRFYGQALLFAPDRAAVERGQRLVEAAIDLLKHSGRSTVSKRAWLAYFEVLLYLRSPAEAVRPIRLAAHRLAEIDHIDAAVRLAELATVEFFAGDHASARRSIELARDYAARTGNPIALAPLAAIENALDVSAASFGPEHGRRFDDTAAELEASLTLTHFTALIAAEFGMVLVDAGYLDAAHRYLQLAESTLGTTYFAHAASLRCRRLRGLILLAEGSVDEARACLEPLRAEAAAEGRTALADTIDTDLLDRITASAEETRTSDGEASPVVVHVLGPELALTVDGERMPAPRGYPAKLLALLIASRGVMTIDAAIEGMWPGADPEVGRNRLHGVLLRLRRSLGLPASGPISCTEGLVRLEPSPLLEVDSWEFERLGAAETRPEARVAALASYGGDVLSSQFAYDDAVAEYRRDLRRMFLRQATAALSDVPSAVEPTVLASLARRAWHLASDDDHVCRASALALAGLGHTAEARELVDGTAGALTELGLDGDEFRWRVLCELGLVSVRPTGVPSD